MSLVSSDALTQRFELSGFAVARPNNKIVYSQNADNKVCVKHSSATYKEYSYKLQVTTDHYSTLSNLGLKLKFKTYFYSVIKYHIG